MERKKNNETGKGKRKKEKKRKRKRKGKCATMKRIGCFIALSLFLLPPFLVAILGIKTGILTVRL